MMEHVTTWGDALMSAFTNATTIFAGALPKIIAFLIILIIGWMVAAGLAKGMAFLLRKLKFNDIAEKAGIAKFVQNAGLSMDAAEFVAQVVKWFVRLIVLVVAFNALGLPEVSSVLNNLLLWLPNLFVALVILTIGGWAANAVATLVRGASTTAQSESPNFLVNVAKTSVWLFTGIVALNQLGIASELVQILFTAIVGALALAFALALGLGGKDVAADFLRKLYDKHVR